MPSKKNLPSKDYLNGKKLTSLYAHRGEEFWKRGGEKRVLELFHEMTNKASGVPAYRKFLEKHGVDPTKIKTIDDFRRHVPAVDKDSYLRKYLLPQLSFGGDITKGSWVISATSGSTGEPFYFPRQSGQDLQYAAVAEAYLLTNFDIDKKSTLYIIGFPLGVWIGGIFTYQALRYISDRGGYDLTVISPGINKEEILKSVQRLGHHYDQIIIGSYGPFLKDILDDGEAMGIKWSNYNMGFVFSAEGFTEKFRDYVLKRTKAKNKLKASLNHYGAVDLGTMSYETPASIMIRRLALNNKNLYTDLFGDTNKLPTFTQYDPQLFYFEETVDRHLLCSVFSGLPLIRYDLKDHGGVKTASEVRAILKKNGIELDLELEKQGISDTWWELPFVYVYERSDMSVSFFAFQIYPETIRKALQHSDLEPKITGKFTMMVDFDEDQNQFFEVNIEMKSSIKASDKLEKELQTHIFEGLTLESSEYRETYRQKGDRVLPRVKLYKYEDPLFFKPGTKQKWVKK